MGYVKKEVTVFDRNFANVEKKAHTKRREFEDEGWFYNESRPWTDGDTYYISLYFTKNEQRKGDEENNISKNHQNIVVEWAKEIMNIAKLAYGAQGVYKNEHLREIIGSCKAIITTLDCCDDKDL